MCLPRKWGERLSCLSLLLIRNVRRSNGGWRALNARKPSGMAYASRICPSQSVGCSPSSFFHFPESAKGAAGLGLISMQSGCGWWADNFPLNRSRRMADSRGCSVPRRQRRSYKRENSTQGRHLSEVLVRLDCGSVGNRRKTSGIYEAKSRLTLPAQMVDATLSSNPPCIENKS
jgi:hypothetical protein